MSELETITRDLAVATALEAVLAERKSTLKARAKELLTRGTVYAYADEEASEQLGYLSIPKPSQPKPRIVDEAAAVGWWFDTFGDDESGVTLRLSEIGKKSALQAVADGKTVPGIETPEPRASSPRFVPASDVVELVSAMVRSGRLSLDEVHQIGGTE